MTQDSTPMSATEDFLKRIWGEDASGSFAIAIKNGDSPLSQKFVSSIPDAAKVLHALNRPSGRDTYYGISVFKNGDSRTQDNVLSTKVVAFDVDVGKARNSYATVQEALTALKTFLAETSLPCPMIVSSGKGLHLYWVLSRALAPEEWQPLAASMKQIALTKKFVIDPAVPADSARILRPVGTTHSCGASVRILRDSKNVEPKDLLRIAGRFVRVQPPTPAKRTLLNNLAVKQDYPPADAKVVATKCQQIAWAVFHQDKVEEPFWYSLLGVASCTEHPEETAKEWSRDHPAYSETATLRKLAQWKASTSGPALCEKFEALRPAGCKGCPFKGKVKSPVQLSIKLEKAPELEAAKAPPELELLAPPWPFKRTARGMYMTIDDVDVEVFPYDIYPVNYGMDEQFERERAKFMWNKPHRGWTALDFDNAHLMQGSMKFAETCADQGVPANNKPYMERFQYMLRSYINALRDTKPPVDTYDAMGWKQDYTRFSLGNRMVYKNEAGDVVEEGMNVASGLREVAPHYVAAGSFEESIAATKIFDRCGLHELAYAFGSSLASVLYEFSGFKGSVISLVGDSGVGKSLAQHWIQSLWGNPERLHMSANSTANAVFNRMGALNNLPFTLDEVTTKSGKEMGEFCFTVSEGSEKMRLTKSAELRKPKHWALIACTSSNISLAAKRESEGADNAAQAARTVEITVPNNRYFTASPQFGRVIYQNLVTNYGWIGPAFVAELIRMGPDAVRTMVRESVSSFAKNYGVEFAGMERFWENNAALVDLALRKAREWGLSHIDERAAVKAALNQLTKTREETVFECDDWLDITHEYLNEIGQYTTRTVTVGHGQPQAIIEGTRVPDVVHAELQLEKPTPQSKFSAGVIHIVKKPFKQWLAKRYRSWPAYLEYVRALGLDVTVNEGRITIGSCIGIGKQLRVLSLDIFKSPRLMQMLDKSAAIKKPGLTVVPGGKQ